MGAKCDSGNFQEIFSGDIKVAITDPVYPVYVDTNVMAGAPVKPAMDATAACLPDGNKANGFIPALPSEPVDLIYLCFPNNPTGAMATREQLKQWVDYARDNRALILYDAAYGRSFRTR